MQYPGVGVGVYIRKDEKILLGKRKGGHGAGEWCPPGGKLEMREDPLECAIRETREETGLDIKNVRFVGITSDVWPEVGTHYVTVWYVTDWDKGDARVVEPDKFEEWRWFSWGQFPEPLFLSTRNFIQNSYNPFNI